MENYKPLKRILIYVVLWFPAIIILTLITVYGQNIPIGDDLVTPGLFFPEVFHKGFSLNALLSQHNEGRFAFPKLVWYLTYPIIGWQLKAQMFLSLIIEICVSLSIFRLLRKLFPDKEKIVLICLFLSNLFLFSTLQYENWIWGMQWITFVPIACLLGIISLNDRPSLYFSVKVLISILFSYIAMFSFPNGMIVWLVSYLLIFRGKLFPYKDKYWYIWIGSCAFSFFIYFYGYVHPVAIPSILGALHHPLKFTTYLLTIVGSPLFALKQNFLTVIIGSFVLLFYTVILFYLYKKESFKNYYVYAFISIGLFSFLSMVQISLGRTMFNGGESIIPSRYYGQSTLIYVSLIALVVYIALNSNYFKENISKKFVKNFLYLIVGGVLVLILFGYWSGFKGFKFFNGYVQKIHVCFSLLEAKMVDTCQEGFVKPYMMELEGEYISNKDVLKPITIFNDLDTKNINGLIETIDQQESVVVIRGWAADPTSGLPANFVFVKLESHDQEPVWVISVVEGVEPDVTSALGKNKNNKYGWISSLHIIGNIDQYTVRAWGINSETLTAYPLSTKNKNIE